MEIPACYGLTELFFGPDDDGRTEIGRRQRELYCKSICFKCLYRVRCLYRCIQRGEVWGVWGAMGEGERRKFVEYLSVLGYDEIPEEHYFRLALRSFYEYQVNNGRRSNGNGAGHLAGGNRAGGMAAKYIGADDYKNLHR
mgnify:CR=1 FL=1